MKHTNCLKLTMLLLLLLIGVVGQAQVTTNPSPALEGSPVQIIYDATKGNAGLSGVTGDVYAHIGVITDKSTSGSDWKYVKAGWSENKPECKMTRSSSNANLYTLDLTPSIRAYFGVPTGEAIKQVALVFRNADGSKTGKTASGGDIFVDVFSSAIALKLTTPVDGSTFLVNNVIPITATATASKIELFIDGVSVTSVSNGSLSYNFQPTAAKKYSIKVVASEGSNSETQTVSVNVLPNPSVEDLPVGAKLGLTVTGGKALFVLEAPGKKFVNLIGSFNSFKVDPNFMLKKTSDGTKFWMTIDTLRSNVDYSYQYLVDGTITVADPYSTLVLDPWNDKYITSETYPSMPQYPTDMAKGIVSSFRLNPTSYNWQVNDFTPAPNSRLNIYELHIRDFVGKHDYKTLIDTINYIKNLGVNVVELMPVNEFEGNSSWGYNPSFYFAPDKYYGPANDLKKFVDECHKQGVAVVLDMVLNHSFGQSPLAQLYMDYSTWKVTPDNPWYNVVSPNSTYSWGYDFNHESKYTQAFVDSVNAYWMKEFKVDGYRFDFTKGFTQKTGDGWAYDASRINILKRMNSEIKKRNPNALVILEHLADNTEEIELSSAGMLLWGNINNNSCEAAMGYNDGNKSDLTWASYKARTWTNPNLVSYMESHDEERVGYKQSQWGNVGTNYNGKDPVVANQRHGALATIFLSIPGPKMIWQWQELGYNYSINTCEDGTINANGDCRTSPKPLFWNKNTNTPENESNLKLKAAFAKVMGMRNKYDVFSTSNFETSLTSAVKSVKLNGADMNVIAVGNFDIVNQPFESAVVGSGYYYSETTKDSVQIQNGKITMNLAAGEFHILTSKRLFTPLKLKMTAPTTASSFYVDESFNITATSSAPKMSLYINGTKIGDYTNGSISYSYKGQKAGSLLIKVVATDGTNVEEKSSVVTIKDLPITLIIGYPKDGDSFFVNDQVQITASANSNTLNLMIDDQEVASGTSSLSYTYNATKAGRIKLYFTATNTTQTKDSLIYITVKSKMAVNSFGPNPVIAGNVVKFNVKPTSNEEVVVSVYNLSGKLVMTKKVSLYGDIENTFEIPTGISGITKGIHVVKITGKSVNITQKIVVL